MDDLTITPARQLPRELRDLVAASTAEGFRFLERLRDDWIAGTNRFDGPGEILLRASLRGRLAGICGVNRDPYARGPAVGRLRHLYVMPSCRRLGVARSLVECAITAARPHFTVLRLRTDSPDAALFYRAMGFRAARGLPHATHVRTLA